ncbi:MAG: DUF6259 domain-containing protein, partial [Victivallaceae bacterium]
GAEELFNGTNSLKTIAVTACGKNFISDYPELFRIALWQNGDYNNKFEIAGKWPDLDKNGEASYPQAKVKVSINKVNSEEISWNIKVTPAAGYGVYSVKYPTLAAPTVTAPDEKLLWPYQSGIALDCPSKMPDKQAGNRPRFKNAIWFGTYGDKFQSMQMIIYAIGQNGFMLWTQDPEGYIKDFSVSKSDVSGACSGKAMLFAVYHFPSNTGMPGVAWNGQYPIITTSFSGGWYQAAKRYREWAVKQWWCKDNTIAQRLKDERLAPWFAKNSLWLTAIDYKSSGKLIEKFAAEFPDTEIGVFLTQWQHWGFDENVPEYFPPKDASGYKKLIAMQANRLHMFPYMNVNLIDTEYSKAVAEFAPAYSLPLPNNAMAPDNGKSAESYIEQWGKIEERGVTRKRCLQPMCRTTTKWHDAWLELANRNLQHYGTDGQYVDQLVAAVYPCWSKNHGHLPGFGPYWLRDSRKILEDIRKANPGKILYSENINEIYIGAIEDVYAAYPEYFRYNIVPLFQTVYHDYVSMHECYIMPETLKNPGDFAQVLSNSVHIGFKPGSFFTTRTIAALLKPENKQSMDFLKAVENTLRKTIMISLYGERLANPIIKDSPEHQINYWKSGKPTAVQCPAVTGSCWRSGTKPQQTMLFLTNSGNRETTVEIFTNDIKDGTKIKNLKGDTIIFKQGMKLSLKPLSVVTLITENNNSQTN